MIIDINKKMLNSIVKQSLQISIELYNSGQNSFMKMSEYFNLYHFNYNSLNDGKINQLVDLMKKKHQHSGKLSSYPSIEKNYRPSFYQFLNKKFSSRKTQNGLLQPKCWNR